MSGVERVIAFGLFGAGGAARDVMPFARQCLAEYARDTPGSRVELFFVDRAPQVSTLNGTRVISEREFFERMRSIDHVLAGPVAAR